MNRRLLILTLGVLLASGTGICASSPPAHAAAPTTQIVAAKATDDSCDPAVPRKITTPSEPLDRLGISATRPIATGKGVTVAVVDSGVMKNNSHLQDAVMPGVTINPYDSDTQGLDDATGHGTAIAGIIAAREVDGSALVGVAPDAKILPIRVFYSDADQQIIDQGFGPTDEKIAQGITTAANDGAQIINVSMSTTVDSKPLRDAVALANSKGALVVASAGNADPDAEKSEDSTTRYPAAYPHVLAVSASTTRDDAVTDSVLHSPDIDVVAPGDLVLTTFFAADDCILSADAPQASYATAYVSGSAALIAERWPDESPDQWAFRLMSSAARPQADSRDDVMGWGIVQPYEALNLVDDGTLPGPESPSHTQADGPRMSEPSADLDLDSRADPIAWTTYVAGIVAVLFLGAGVAISLTHLRAPQRQQSGRHEGIS